MANTLGEVIVGVRLDTRDTQAQIAALKGQLAGISGAAGAAAAATAGPTAASRFGLAAAAASARLGSFASKANSFGRTIGAAGRTLNYRLTLPLALLGTTAVKSANSFEAAFARIDALAGKIGVPIDEAKEKVKQLAVEFGRDPQEVVEALYFIASSGIKASDAMSVLRSSVAGAAQQLGSAQVIAQLLTTVMNNYGQSGMTAAEGLAVLTAVIKKGKAEPAELAASLANVVPQASQLSVSFASMAAAVAQATNAGLSAARASTGLRFILGSLQRPSEQAKDVLKEYGITVEDLQNKFKELGATGGIQYLAKLFDTSTTKGKEAFAILMGGQRGLIIANALIGENFKKAQAIDEFVSKMAKSSIAEDALKKATNTSAFQFQKLMAGLKVAAIELGDVLVPILVNDVLPVIKAIVEGFQNMKPDTQKLVVWSTIFLGLLGPVMSIAGVVARLIAGIAWIGSKGLGILAGSAATSVVAGAATQTVAGLSLPVLGASAAVGGGAAAGAGVGAAGVSVSTILTPLIITAVVALVAAYFEKKRDDQRVNELTNPSVGGPTTDLLDPNLRRAPRTYSGVGGNVNPSLTDDQKFVEARLSFSNSLRFADFHLQRWAQMVSLQYTMSNEQANTMVGLIRSIEGATGAFDKGKRNVLLGYLKQGDVTQALKYLADMLRIATEGVRNFSTAMLQSSGRAAASGIGGQRVNPEGLAGEHGLIGLAGGGFLVTRPTFIRNNVLTGEKRKKEAVIPLEDVRGRRVLAGAMADAMGSAGSGTVVVNVAGKVERPEDIKRELDWWMRSRGL